MSEGENVVRLDGRGGGEGEGWNRAFVIGHRAPSPRTRFPGSLAHSDMTSRRGPGVSQVSARGGTTKVEAVPRRSGPDRTSFGARRRLTR